MHVIIEFTHFIIEGPCCKYFQEQENSDFAIWVSYDTTWNFYLFVFREFEEK